MTTRRNRVPAWRQTYRGLIRRASTGLRWLSVAFVTTCCVTKVAPCQTVLTWPEVRGRFEAANPTLQDARIGIHVSEADVISAGLRLYPHFTSTTDGV